MPIHTVIRPELAEVVRGVTGNLTNEQVAIRTGISAEYVRKIRTGLVPSEAILVKFASGMNVDLHDLLIPAGYEQPTDVVEAVNFALRGATNIPDEGKKQILDFAKMVEKKYTGEHKHSFNHEEPEA